MKPKTIVTATLLLFVAASVVYLVVKETGAKPEQNPAQPETTAPRTGQEQDTQPAGAGRRQRGQGGRQGSRRRRDQGHARLTGGKDVTK